MASASEILAVTSITSESITVSINKGTYYGVNLFIRADGSLTGTQIKNITDTSYTFTGLSEMTTYYLNAEYLTSATDTGQGFAENPIEVYVPGTADNAFTLVYMEADTNSIGFYIDVVPEPVDWTERYSYEVYYKKSSDSDYLCYEFWDDAPDILNKIELVYNIEHSTTYQLYVKFWYNGTSIVGQTPVYTITTATPSAIPSIEILSLERKGDTLTVAVKNTGVDFYQFWAYYSGDLSDGKSMGGSNAFYCGDVREYSVTLSSSYCQGAIFVYFYGSYGAGGNYKWYFIEEKMYSYTASNGKEYAVFEGTEYTPFLLKVDDSTLIPWDEKYRGCTKTVSPFLDNFAWSPLVGTTSYPSADGHTNVWISNTDDLYEGDSVMEVNIALPYPCTISFGYAISSLYDYLVVTLDSKQIDKINGRTDGRTWLSYAASLEAGEHVLQLSFEKGGTSSYRIRGFGFFADFAIIPKKPSVWNWGVSNHSADADATKLAYEMASGLVYGAGTQTVGDRLCNQFHHTVWNDMCLKVKHILDYLAGDYNGGTWVTALYGQTYDATLMDDVSQYGKYLTANRFNSLRYNIDQWQNTSIAEVQTGDTVLGELFCTFMNCVNTYIETYIGT